MSEDNAQKILAFLSGALALEGPHSCQRIDVTYQPNGAYRADPLRTWLRETNPDLFDNRAMAYVEKLVGEIIQAAEDYADSYGSGRHRFVLRTHKHLGGRQTMAFIVLPKFDGTEDPQALATSDGSGLVPTERGLVGQLMRHLETRDRMNKEMTFGFMNAMNHHAAAMREENKEMRDQLAAKDKERMEWLKTIEDARSTEHQRQIEASVVIAEQERKTMATNKVVSLLPVMLSKLLGSGKPKEGTASATPPSPLAQTVHKLLTSMDDDQKANMVSILSMEQQIAFTEIWNVVDNGDSALLPSMMSDLYGGLQQKQVAALLALLNPEQRTMFGQAIQLAQAATAGTNLDPAKADKAKTTPAAASTPAATPTEKS